MFKREQKNLTINDYISLLEESSIIFSVGFDPKTNHVTVYPFDDARLKPLDYWGSYDEVLDEIEYYYQLVTQKEKKLKREDNARHWVLLFMFGWCAFSFIRELAVWGGVLFFLWQTGLIWIILK